MEIIYINSDNIKIHLTENDLADGGLSADSINYSTTKTKKFLWGVFDKVNEKTGFDAADGKLYIRVFPSEDGSCELFVTRLRTKSGNSLYTTYKESDFIIKINGYDKLYSLCRRLKNEGFHGRSELFSDKTGSYYLACRSKRPSYMSGYGSGNFSFVSEYGEQKDYTEELAAYLAEHFEIICKSGAVEKITM